jgi:hypothetical protein
MLVTEPWDCFGMGTGQVAVTWVVALMIANEEAARTGGILMQNYH